MAIAAAAVAEAAVVEARAAEAVVAAMATVEGDGCNKGNNSSNCRGKGNGSR